MRALVVAIVRGLVKGLVIGLALGLVLTFALRWPVPVGSLLGYLAAMAACGTTGIAGGDAPWREGAWLPAALKAVAGVAVGALAYWVLGAHLDAPLPELLSALLGPTAEGASASWIAKPASTARTFPPTKTASGGASAPVASRAGHRSRQRRDSARAGVDIGGGG